MVVAANNIRLTGMLSALGIATSSWYRRPKLSEERQCPGPRPLPIDPQIVTAVVAMAKDNPWYGIQADRRDVPSRRSCRQEP